MIYDACTFSNVSIARISPRATLTAERRRDINHHLIRSRTRHVWEIRAIIYPRFFFHLISRDDVAPTGRYMFLNQNGLTYMSPLNIEEENHSFTLKTDLDNFLDLIKLPYIRRCTSERPRCDAGRKLLGATPRTFLSPSIHLQRTITTQTQWKRKFGFCIYGSFLFGAFSPPHLLNAFHPM